MLPTNQNPAILEKYNLNSAWKYRAFLQSHSQHIKNALFDESARHFGASPVPAVTAPPAAGGPYVYRSLFDAARPAGYEESDLKNNFITGRVLRARMVAPTFSGKLSIPTAGTN